MSFRTEVKRQRPRDAEPDGADWWLQQMSRPECEPLSTADEQALAVRARAGDPQARDALITHNVRLVIGIARRYVGHGVDLDDLICAGNRGLMHAIDKFEPTRGYRLSTYATSWIRQACSRMVHHESRAIRLPDYLYARDKRARLVALDYLQPLSLDAPMGAAHGGAHGTPGTVFDKPDTLHNLIEDDGPSVEQQIEDRDEQASAWDELQRLFARGHLSEREQRVLALRYAGGVDGGELTLEQCGKRLGITRERARQIEANALRKLRQAAGVAPTPPAAQGELWQVGA